MTDLINLQRRLRLALQQDNVAEAIICLRDTIVLVQASGDRSAEGRHLGNLALLYYRAGQVDDSLRCFEEALTVVQEVGDRITEEGLLGNMGNILREVGQYEAAITYLNQALLIAQELGDMRGRGIWLSNLGLVYDDLAESDQAVTYHQQSVAIAREIHDQRGLASRLHKLGNSFYAACRYEQAQVYFFESLTLYGILGDMAGLREMLVQLGFVHQWLAAETLEAASSEHQRKAVGYLRQAQSIAQESGDVQTTAEISVLLGDALGNNGDYAGAYAEFAHAYHLFMTLGLKDALIPVRQRLEQADALRRAP